jgi:phosphoribosyl 1,2-cyclic phosphodiesterase
VKVTFYGVRGSTPCSSPATLRYGGNTSSVVIESPGEPPLLLDLGTGLRAYGASFPDTETFAGNALVSHLHWDHVQGIPFFSPALRPGATLNVYGPVQEDGRSLAEAFDTFFRPPYFPITLSQLPADLRFIDCEEGVHHIGGYRVTARVIPHVGRTLGFRIESEAGTVAYLPDHQQPYDGGFDVTDAAMELCEGADLLIHDAQFTRDEFRQKYYWGHCMVDYAVAVGLRARVGTLALFHHDPSHDDRMLDELTRCASEVAGKRGMRIVAAAEGLSMPVRPVVAA